jgi:hypothetical protein
MLAGIRVWTFLEVNLTQVVLVKNQAKDDDIQQGNDATWEAGWQSVCQTFDGKNATPVSTRTLLNVVRTQLERGAYDTALAALDQAAAEGWIGQVDQAAAYRAALRFNWSEAAREYRPEQTPRLQRWWGTIFYLAAQQRWFDGDAAGAAPFYRQADAMYSTQGPYLGLVLANCLKDQNRLIEAWDAMRRGLVVLPADEALAHQTEFESLRLDALQQWQQRALQDKRVQHWLEFYHTANNADETMILTHEPTPQVGVEADLGEGRKLIGFDYRGEDLETGPFMTVDFYVRDGTQVNRERRTVLNQAPNGAFKWDAVPDGVRPVGWHAFVYEPNPSALTHERIVDDAPWLCLDAGRLGVSYGAQSVPAPLQAQSLYLQGGLLHRFAASALSLGRHWTGTSETHPYSYVPGRPAENQSAMLPGTWQPPAEAQQMMVWLQAHQTGKGCFTQLYLFSIPAL